MYAAVPPSPQQVIKVALLTRDKTIIRKAREAVGAILLELLLPKDKILEWYINLAEFGDGVYGLREGAKHYFATKPEQLTIAQGVHLALVLPSPNRWSRGLRQERLTKFGRGRFQQILDRMPTAWFLSPEQLHNQCHGYRGFWSIGDRSSVGG